MSLPARDVVPFRVADSELFIGMREAKLFQPIDLFPRDPLVNLIELRALFFGCLKYILEASAFESAVNT